MDCDDINIELLLTFIKDSLTVSSLSSASHYFTARLKLFSFQEIVMEVSSFIFEKQYE